MPRSAARDIVDAMAALRYISVAGVEAIRAVVAALSEHAPHLLGHFDRAVVEVHLAPHRCPPGSAACVRADLLRVVLLAQAPEHVPMAELGVNLLHEARHLRQAADGSWHIYKHHCSDPLCLRPAERAADPIYRADAALRPHIEHALRRAGYAPEKPYLAPAVEPAPAPTVPNPWEALVQILGVGATVMIGAAVVNRMTKTWDPRVQRYRDRNGGRLRGGGLFE